MKRHLRHSCTPSERAEGEVLPPASILRRHCAYYSIHALSFHVVGYNVSL